MKSSRRRNRSVDLSFGSTCRRAAVAMVLAGERRDCLRRDDAGITDNLAPLARQSSRCLRLRHAAVGALTQLAEVFTAGVWRITRRHARNIWS